MFQNVSQRGNGVNKKLKQFLSQYLPEEDIKKIEKVLRQKHLEKQEKIRRIKELIERGEYNVSAEEVAEKMLEYFKEHQ